MWLSACGNQDPASFFAATDPAGRLFDPQHIIEVSIEIDSGDWETLRHQTRFWWDVSVDENRACMDEPFHKPFEWFPATVTVDGIRRTSVALRKKGFLGSVYGDRPALKVRFDKYQPQQTLHGLTRLTLNNSEQDPTWLRQCLAYRVFEKAGVPVPWCNFAHLSVNGQDLGLYVHVESFDRHWLRRHWERDEGDLWEGEFSDFRPGWVNTFEKKGDVPNDDQNQVARQTLFDVGLALGRADDEVRSGLQELIHFDGFMRFWATEKILEHWDGYANNLNNFILYRDPATEKFVFAPSGTDQITVVDPLSPVLPPVSVYSVGAIANRLYAIPETRELYVATIREVLDRAFHEGELLAEIDRMQALVAPVIARSGPEATARQAEAIEGLRNWVRKRRAVLLADLANGPREWSQPLKSSICRDLAGNVSGTFATTFGTPIGADLFLAGIGTLAGEYRRVPLNIFSVGAGAMFEIAPENPWVFVNIVARAFGGRVYTLAIFLNPEQLGPGAHGPFSGRFSWGYMGQWDPRTRQWTYMGGLVGGRVEIDQVGLDPGDPVSGRFEAMVVQW